MHFPHSLLAQSQPAFAGAIGFGASATGGSGGDTYHVTTLRDSGAGSFRDAVSAGHRIVAFDIPGVISLASPVSVHSDVTIDGSTAPSTGITLFGQEISFSHSSNIIVRYVRIRQGVGSDKHKSSVAISNGANMIFDHVSVEWGRWDCIDMNGSSNITFQDCLIGEGVNPQRFGCLCGSTDITFFHDLWIDNQSRNPKAKGKVQFIDNVVYDWGVDGLVEGNSSGVTYDDVINNYFIAGPNSSSHAFGMGNANAQVFASGNYIDMNKNGKLDGVPTTPQDFGPVTLAAAPFAAAPAAIDSAEQAYRHVVAEAGDSRARDAVDTRLIGYLESLGSQGQIVETPPDESVDATIPASNASTNRHSTRHHQKTQ